MYLKSIEIIGFKSFANKTLIELKPGITAIVGPNGCGKSNVSDAVRWVLGEQRAKALRGSNMQDIIFNGTDDAKPMGMAEVSLTLTDCSKSLNTEYDEVCITRRVYRSNESGYFINKKACRLKDIQRLFMDTGIGTDSYSVLEQGKIDQILSAKPEDRRTVFEEASGITKFKTDKKESLRKLDQTEANLIRLEDVIKEVKRQIISLQRQAGKAKRYKELKKEMKSLDLYLSSKQLNILKLEIENLTNKLHENEKEIENLQITIKNEEDNSRIARTGLTEKENFITPLKLNSFISVFSSFFCFCVFNKGINNSNPVTIIESNIIVVCHPNVFIEKSAGAININWPNEAEAAAIPMAIDFFSGGAVFPIIAIIVDIPPAPKPIPVTIPKL